MNIYSTQAMELMNMILKTFVSEFLWTIRFLQRIVETQSRFFTRVTESRLMAEKSSYAIRRTKFGVLRVCL